MAEFRALAQQVWATVTLITSTPHQAIKRSEALRDSL
jgi:hypothetical protein